MAQTEILKVVIKIGGDTGVEDLGQGIQTHRAYISTGLLPNPSGSDGDMVGSSGNSSFRC